MLEAQPAHFEHFLPPTELQKAAPSLLEEITEELEASSLFANGHCNKNLLHQDISFTVLNIGDDLWLKIHNQRTELGQHLIIEERKSQSDAPIEAIDILTSRTGAHLTYQNGTTLKDSQEAIEHIREFVHAIA